MSNMMMRQLIFLPEKGDYSGDGFSVWLRIPEKAYHALKSL